MKLLSFIIILCSFLTVEVSAKQLWKYDAKGEISFVYPLVQNELVSNILLWPKLEPLKPSADKTIVLLHTTGTEVTSLSLRPNLRLSKPLINYPYLLWFETDEVFGKNWLVVYNLSNKRILTSKDVSSEIPDTSDISIWQHYLIIKTNKYGNSSNIELYNYRKMGMEANLHTRFSSVDLNFIYATSAPNSLIELNYFGQSKTLLPKEFGYVNDIKVIDDDIYVFGSSGPGNGSDLLARFDRLTLSLKTFAKIPWVDSKTSSFSYDKNKVALSNGHSIMVFDTQDFRLLNEILLPKLLKNPEFHWSGKDAIHISSSLGYRKMNVFEWALSSNDFNKMLEAQNLLIEGSSIFYNEFGSDGQISLYRQSLIGNSTIRCVSKLASDEKAIEVNFRAEIPYYLAVKKNSGLLKVYPWWNSKDCNQSFGPEIKNANDYFTFKDGLTNPAVSGHLFIENSSKISYWR